MIDKYPKIEHYSRKHGGKHCHIFEKYDGTNIAFEYIDGVFKHPKFRSGKTIYECGYEIFNNIEVLFRNSPYYDILTSFAKLYKKNFIFYAEFFGKNSFSGEHVLEDEKCLMPIDLYIEDSGFLEPEKFCKMFDIKPVYIGRLTTKVVEDVKDSVIKVNEGVVCKGNDWSCKIKTKQWLLKGGEL